MRDLEMNNHYIRMKQNSTDLELEDLDESIIQNFLFCLPIRKEEDNNEIGYKYKYYIIDSDWLELNEHDKLIQSKCPL